MELNLIVKKELLRKKQTLLNIKNLSSHGNEEVLHKYELFLEFLICYIDMNPSFSQEKILQRIVGENKLYFAVLEIQ